MEPGSYTVTASLEGELRQRTIQVGKAPGPMQYLRWSTQPELAAQPSGSEAAAGGSGAK
jgi:hypothetical protein